MFCVISRETIRDLLFQKIVNCRLNFFRVDKANRAIRFATREFWWFVAFEDLVRVTPVIDLLSTELPRAFLPYLLAMFAVIDLSHS